MWAGGGRWQAGGMGQLGHPALAPGMSQLCQYSSRRGDTSVGTLPMQPALVPQFLLCAGDVRAIFGTTRQDLELCRFPAGRSWGSMRRQVGREHRGLWAG